jgi:hypothetical protein
MATLKGTIDVQVPRAHLFTHLATLWESGEGFDETGKGLASRKKAPLAPSFGRMGPGLRVPFQGDPWGPVSDSELEIRSYTEPVGWSAVSVPASTLSLEVGIFEEKRGTRLTCVLRYRPEGLFAFLLDPILGKRRRRRRLHRLLTAWKTTAERNERLQRLKSHVDRT